MCDPHVNRVEAIHSSHFQLRNIDFHLTDNSIVNLGNSSYHDEINEINLSRIKMISNDYRPVPAYLFAC